MFVIVIKHRYQPPHPHHHHQYHHQHDHDQAFDIIIMIFIINIFINIIITIRLLTCWRDWTRTQSTGKGREELLLVSFRWMLWWWSCMMIMVIRMRMMVIVIKDLTKILMTNMSNHQMQKRCLFFLRWSLLEEKTDKHWQTSSRYWGTLKTHRQWFF